ncbi:glycosyltransferase, group 1 family protein [Mobiluncus curtisii ATCC 51333]|uniref:Glycosyltransferase, group 1 family protein n=2 Tax=Mobiluncus curtisii TaxID=2051 RepID=E6LXH6_9ACTO|nr:glycosyltransferase, group 1 family protein [Mobiluncus curtisii ATCC 51333]
MGDDILGLKSVLIKLNHQWHLARYAYPLATFFSRLLSPDKQIQARIAILGMALIEGKKPCLSLAKRLTARALELADLRYQSGELLAASRLLTSALQLYYHSKLVGALDSPLLADPNYSALIRQSRFYQEIFETAVHPPTSANNPTNRGKTGENIMAGKEDLTNSRPLKILALSRYHYNFYFSLEQFAYLREQGHTVTLLAMENLPGYERMLSIEEAVQRGVRLAQGQTNPIPEQLRDAVNEADLIWVEWGNETAVLVSQWEVKKPVLVHLHRYESESSWLHLLNPRGISGIFFVSDWVKQVTLSQRPSLAGVPTQVIPIGINPYLYSTAKTAAATRTIAQVGWKVEIKDTYWTINLVKRLRETDPTWRLLLVGPEPDSRDAWARPLYKLISANSGWITVTGNREDLADYFKNIGWVVSSSRLESFHRSVVEGSAAGCVPVVRDWPEVARYGGARGIYPEDWVVANQEEAVARIIETSNSGIPDETARALVLENFNFNLANVRTQRLLQETVARWGASLNHNMPNTAGNSATDES